MTLATMTEALADLNHHSAIWCFGVPAPDVLHAVTEAAEEAGQAVALSVDAEVVRTSGPDFFIAPAVAAAEKASVPVAVHLNHAPDIEIIKTALDCGCTSVMLDGSSLPYSENISLTATAAGLAREYGASVEGEVRIPDLHHPESDIFLSDDRVAEFAAKTAVDFLAVSVGTAHGPKNAEGTVDIATLNRIGEILPCPMALHGSSGVPLRTLALAVKAGVRKINFHSELHALYRASGCGTDRASGFTDIRNCVLRNISSLTPCESGNL